jgi:ubiquinol-cytochrome c reductase iron-sulfur subunit
MAEATANEAVSGSVNETVDQTKRRFLVGATSVVGGIGAVAVATPFVMSLFPSERAKAAGAPVEVDISKLEPGQKIDIEWRGKVVWVINRTNPMLASLPKLDPRLADPNSNQSQQPSDCKNEHRSIKDNVLVMVGICTHLGCSPTYRPEIGPGGPGDRTGSAASSARVTRASSTWPAASTPACRRRRTSRCLRTSTCPIRRS